MATAKKKAPAKQAAPAKKTVPAKKVDKNVSARKRGDIGDESDLVKRNEYFTRGGQKFVRFPSGDVMAITPARGGGRGPGGSPGNGSAGGGRGRFGGGGPMNRGK
jgi:hypothetical protein